mmetsp:Transcript_11391/g.36032  ORF Transcript_11391/g.36032 Transcript_11391/m.36032 type:complete len:204 (-) Transcript_11391:56-667(-)
MTCLRERQSGWALRRALHGRPAQAAVGTLDGNTSLATGCLRRRAARAPAQRRAPDCSAHQSCGCCRAHAAPRRTGSKSQANTRRRARVRSAELACDLPSATLRLPGCASPIDLRKPIAPCVRAREAAARRVAAGRADDAPIFSDDAYTPVRTLREGTRRRVHDLAPHREASASGAHDGAPPRRARREPQLIAAASPRAPTPSA